MVLEDLFLLLHFFPVHPYFYTSTTVFTRPNGLCIKLCLGVTTSNTMSWQNHINNITSRANRMLGLIKRNLRRTLQKLRQHAYFSLVRPVPPHLQYCSTVCHPYIKKGVNKIENIQCRANSYNKRESVSALINHLRWNSLEKRRQLSCLLLMYRIQNQLIAINGNHDLTPMLPTCPVQGAIIQVYIRLSQVTFRSTTILSSCKLSSGGSPSRECLGSPKHLG